MTCQRGFTLPEVAIATAIMATVAAAALTLAAPSHGIHRAQVESADLQQRLRVSVDLLRRDLLQAGTGTRMGAVTSTLTTALAPVMPFRAGELQPDAANGIHFRRDALTILTVPTSSSQADVENGIPDGASDLRVNARFNCGPVEPTELCGFSEGMRAIVFDPAGAWDLMTVTGVESPTLHLRHRRARPANAYGPDAAIAAVEVHAYYLQTDAASQTYQLRRYDGFESDLPIVDDVVKLEFAYFGDPEPPRIRAGAPVADPAFIGPVTTYGPRPPPPGVDRVGDTWPAGENCTFIVVDGEHVPRLPLLAAGADGLAPLPRQVLEDGPWCADETRPDRFDADLLRIRRVRTQLRVQVANAVLRGPAGRLFLRGGTATAGHRVVPDIAIAFDVTPRGMTGR